MFGSVKKMFLLQLTIAKMEIGRSEWVKKYGQCLRLRFKLLPIFCV